MITRNFKTVSFNRRDTPSKSEITVGVHTFLFSVSVLSFQYVSKHTTAFFHCSQNSLTCSFVGVEVYFESQSEYAFGSQLARFVYSLGTVVRRLQLEVLALGVLIRCVRPLIRSSRRVRAFPTLEHSFVSLVHTSVVRYYTVIRAFSYL